VLLYFLLIFGTPFFGVGRFWLREFWIGDILLSLLGRVLNAWAVYVYPGTCSSSIFLFFFLFVCFYHSYQNF